MRTYHLTSGPTRGLEKSAPNGANRHTERHTALSTQYSAISTYYSSLCAQDLNFITASIVTQCDSQFMASAFGLYQCIF